MTLQPLLSTSSSLVKLLIGLVMPLFLAACVKENYDRSNSSFPEQLPIIDTLSCTNELSFSSIPLSFRDEGVAWILEGENCRNLPVPRTHNYLILLDPPETYADSDEALSLPRLGFPCISFSYDGVPPTGISLPQIGEGFYTSFVVSDYAMVGEREWIIEDAGSVKLSMLGTEEGDYVVGTYNGWLTEFDGISPGQSYPLSGSFCVPITRVCR